MPGLVPRTSTFALTNVTLPFIVCLASAGVDRAIRADYGLAEGVDLYRGKVTCRGVADARGLSFEKLP